jgi:hypothetical protein
VPKGHETNLNPPIEGGCDPANQGQGMSFVVGIFQAAGKGGGSADQVG